MTSDALLEELEVLESIYPTELSRISETDIEIDTEPDDLPDGADSLKVTLCVHYTDGYPDILPDLKLRPVEGDLEDDEIKELVGGLRTVGEENAGMAMTFTLVSHLREQLSHLVRTREEKCRKEEMEKERRTLEEEEAKTRGTPVTVESFRIWKLAFDKEVATRKAQDEEERLKGMSAKEKEEWKKTTSRLTGRQLFERGDKHLEDDVIMEDGDVSVDITQYDRTRALEEQMEETLTFSDSD